MDSLLQAKSAFIQWHKQGTSRRHAPMRLKKLAVSLLDHYSLQEVSRSLNISTSRLRYWSDSQPKLVQGAEPSNKTTAHFIPISLSNTPVFNQQEKRISNKTTVPLPPRVLIRLPQGIQLELVNQSTQQSVQIISALMKELHHASLNG